MLCLIDSIVPYFYPIYFASEDELIETFNRDIKNGGLFVPTARPPLMDQEVSIEINLPSGEPSAMTFVAKVVHRIPSGDGAGVGIAFNDPQEVISRLGALVDEMRAD